MKRIFKALVLAIKFVVLSLALITGGVAQAASVQDIIAPLLTAKPGEPTEKAFATAIQQSQKLSASSAFVLTNRLRLQLGAYLLSQNKYDEARSELLKVETKSSSAIEASLLLAHSYRLQGNRDEAVQWFLRAAKQFPYDPAALQGLIDAAEEFEQEGDGQTARLLYVEVVEQTNIALKQLDNLKNQPVIEPAQVFFASDALDEPVRKTLLTFLLRDNQHNVLSSSKALQQNITQLLQLQQQADNLTLQLSALDNQLQQYQQQRKDLAQGYQQNQQLLEQLKQGLLANDFSPEQKQLRQTITQLSNQLQRQKAMLAFVDSAIQKLPSMIDGVDAKQTQLSQVLQQQLFAHKNTVETALNKAVSTYQVAVKEVGGKASLAEASLLESRATKPK